MRVPKYSLVLPCYNEAQTIPQLVEGYGHAVRDRTDVEVIFVDNGSKDNSFALLQSFLDAAKRPWMKVVRVDVNQGYGFGILCGLREAQGNFVGWAHADSQYDPVQVAQAFRILDATESPESTLLQGTREGRPLFDIFFTCMMTIYTRLVLQVPLSDINAQPKLFSRRLLSKLDRPPHDFSLDLYTLVVANHADFQIIRMPIVFGARKFGEAKGGAGSLSLKWKLTKRTLAFITQLRRRMREVE